MKKIYALILTIILTLSILSGCASKNTANTNKKQVVKLGVTGEDHKIWDSVKEKLAKENIELQIISFADYIRPNLALSEGEIDLNSFQHVAYLDKFKADRNLQLVAIGNTILAPLAIFSSSLKSLSELKDGAKVAIPNDATNGGRALNLLQTAGLIKLKADAGLLPTVKDISENPKKLQIIELVATQIPRSLKDVDIAAVNSGVAVDAKLSPIKDSIYLEDVSKDTSKPYVNIIVAREKDKDNPLYKKVVEAYQTEDTKKLLNEIYQGAQIPAF